MLLLWPFRKKLILPSCRRCRTSRADPGPSATRAAPVRVAQSTRQGWATCSHCLREQVAQARGGLRRSCAAHFHSHSLACADPHRVAASQCRRSSFPRSRRAPPSRTGRSASMIIRPRPRHGGGAAHVLLHPQHAARRLGYRSLAGIETDALAAQRDERRYWRARYCRTSGGLRRAALVPNHARPPRQWDTPRSSAIARDDLRPRHRNVCQGEPANSASSAGPRMLAGVFTRSRTIQVAAAAERLPCLPLGRQ